MPSNIRAFELAIDQFVGVELEEMLQARVTAVALEAMKSLMQMTPVDTGRAKGNWQLTLGAFPGASWDEGKKDDSKEGSAPKAGQVVLDAMQDWTVGRFIWMHNGVPYITFLNDGTDRIKAIMMLERTVERLGRWLAR